MVHTQIIQKRIATAADSMDEKEWSNIGQVLRRIYAEGDDMKAMSVTLSPDKQKAADTYIADLKKYSRAGEQPLSEKDGETVIAVLEKCRNISGDFLDLLRDIPDEI